MRASNVLARSLFGVLGCWSAVAFAASACLPGEKRLHASDPECIPAALHSYLYCLENIPGGGVIEVITATNSDRSKRIDVHFKAGASVRLISGEGDIGFSKDNTDKLESAARTTYSEEMAKGCPRPPVEPVHGPGLGPIIPPKPPNLKIPDSLRGRSFSRSNPEVAYGNQDNIKYCTTNITVQEVLTFSTNPISEKLAGNIQFVIYQRRTWNTANPDGTVDVLAAYDKDAIAKCVRAIAPFVVADSAIEIYSTPKEFRYIEKVNHADAT